MTKQFIIQIVILSALAVFYLVFTFRYHRILRKSIVFSPAVKVFHLVMIWIVPFFWALVLKAITKRTPGSYEIENKTDPQPFTKSGYQFPGGGT